MVVYAIVRTIIDKRVRNQISRMTSKALAFHLEADCVTLVGQTVDGKCPFF